MQPSWREGDNGRELFKGDISEAVTKFNAIGETARQPREYQILTDAEGALWRAQEEISALCGGRPDLDTETVYETIEDACLDLHALCQHLESMAPWQAMKAASASSVDAKMAWEAHRRFQRDDQ